MDVIHDIIVGMLVDVTDEDAQWALRVTPSARLEGDLQLESLEFAAFAERLRVRFGDSVDLWEYVRDLTIDDLIALTVSDVVGHVKGRIG